MKLTEAKLKQMILDEMKSNLSAADRDQLESDIELVRELSVGVDSLRKERYQLDMHQKGGQLKYIPPEDQDPEIKEIDLEIIELLRRIRGIANTYNIRHYYDSPGNRDLINLMKKKFRRKSLEESKSREDHMNGAFAAIELYEKGFVGDEPTRNSQTALNALVYSISKGIVACIKEGPTAASLQKELMDKAKELGIFDETMESVLALTKDDVSPEIRLK